MWIFEFSLAVCLMESRSLAFSLGYLVSNGRQVPLGGHYIRRFCHKRVAPVCPVYTAMVTIALVQCYRPNSPESSEAGLVTAMVMAVYRLIFLERVGFGDLAGMVPPPLGRCHRHAMSGDQVTIRAPPP
jgi:hypothetical protein